MLRGNPAPAPAHLPALRAAEAGGRGKRKTAKFIEQKHGLKPPSTGSNDGTTSNSHAPTGPTAHPRSPTQCLSSNPHCDPPLPHGLLPEGPAGGLSPGRWTPAMSPPPRTRPPPLTHSRTRSTTPRKLSHEERRAGTAGHSGASRSPRRPRVVQVFLLQVTWWALASPSSILSFPLSPGTGPGELLREGHRHIPTRTRGGGGPTSTPRKQTVSSGHGTTASRALAGAEAQATWQGPEVAAWVGGGHLARAQGHLGTLQGNQD